MENIKHLQKLAEVFDTDKIITSDEIEQVLKGILVIMNSFKKDNQTLNKETKEVVYELELSSPTIMIFHRATRIPLYPETTSYQTP